MPVLKAMGSKEFSNGYKLERRGNEDLREYNVYEVLLSHNGAPVELLEFSDSEESWAEFQLIARVLSHAIKTLASA
jgi:hypothetical protein